MNDDNGCCCARENKNDTWETGVIHWGLFNSATQPDSHQKTEHERINNYK